MTPVTTSTPTPGNPSRMRTSTYVFAVCRGSGPAPLASVSGHDSNQPVRTLTAGSLTAVVQDVPSAAFSENALHQRLSDRDELERCARAHHEVVSAVAEHGCPTVPLPLATLYHDDDRARRALLDSEQRFLAVLDRVEGCAEWGVKVYAPEAATYPGRPTAPSPPHDGSAPTLGAGRAYLERMRNRQRDREQLHDAALRAAELVDTAVRSLAVAARRLRPHGTELTGKRRNQVLNAAYLLAQDRVGELSAVLQSLQQETGAEIEVSGPWVPYSFVSFADEAAAHA